MKKDISEIFDLIKSMSKSEKRYFQIFAKRHFPKDNQYLRLFTMIGAQKEYHETELTKSFSQGKSASHFAVAKKQLYENILDALHRFDEYAHPEQQLRKGIHYCALLLKKGLFVQCRKQIAKFKAMAYSIEKFENIIELLEIEKRLISRQQYTEHSQHDLEALQQEQNACIGHINLAGDYWIKSSRIFKMHADKIIAPGKENAILRDLIKYDPYFIDDTFATNMRAKLDFLQINALYAFVNSDALKAYQLNAQFLKLLDDKPQFKFLFADRYFSVLNNYLIDSLLLQNYPQLTAGIRALRALQQQTEFKHINNLEANIFRLGYSLEMNYYVITKQFTNAMQCRTEIEAGLKKYARKISKTGSLTLQYLVIYALFCCKKFDDCLAMLQSILQIRETEQAADIYRDSRMIQLLCHFELGNYQLLESLLVSFNRLLSAKKSQMRIYKIVLSYVKHYSQKVAKPSVLTLKKQLSECMADEKENIAFNNIDYLYWAGEITAQKIVY